MNQELLNCNKEYTNGFIRHLLDKKIHPGKIALCMITILATVYLLISDLGPAEAKVGAGLLLCVNAATIYRIRANKYLLFIMLIITYYNYSICAANYFEILPKTFFMGYAGTGISYQGLKILLLFNVLLALIIRMIVPEHIPKTTWSLINDAEPNRFIVSMLLILLIGIWAFGFVRPDTAGQRGSPSTYFEYSIILFIAGFYYSGRSKFCRGLFILAGFGYIVLNFMYGGRATGVQIILCMVLCLAIDKISPRILIVCGIGLFLILSMIGSMRATVSFSADAITATVEKIKTTWFASDTAYSAYFTSMTFLDYLSSCSISMRLMYFLYYLLAIVAGGMVPDSNLPIITRRYFTHYYGGVLPYYFYFYLGIAGILIITAYLLWLFYHIVKNTTQEQPKGIWHWIGIYIASTALRWYIYSPSQITRGVIILAVLFYLLRFLDNHTAKTHTKQAT